MIVYKVTNKLNEKVYIGITIRGFFQRKSEHIKDAFKHNSESIFHKALRDCGEDNFTWEIIDFANDTDKLKEKEIYWIKYYNSCIFNNGNNGYNMTLGGDGLIGFEHLDGSKKGINKGSNNPSAKLKEVQVLEIKKLLIDNSLTQKEIAIKFNVSIDIVSQIKKGKSWSHVGEDISEIEYWNSKKLTEKDVIKIKELIKLQTPFIEIANKFDVAKITIQQIKKGKTWSHIGEDVSNIKYEKVKKKKINKESSEH